MAKRIYETSTVFAFSTDDSDKHEKAHGNPALIVFADEISVEDKGKITSQARISINSEDPVILPIIDFIRVNDLNKKIFDVEYWLPFREVPVCGHGTIGAVRAIIDRYGLNDGKEHEYTFNLNTKKFPVNVDFPQLKVKSDGKTFKLEVDDVTFPEPLSSDDPAFHLIKQELKGNFIDGTLYFTPLQDYVCVCKDAKQLRNTVIPVEKLIELRNIKKEERNYRLFVAMAPSDIEGYDYETTVFSDELPEPVYKDPACGSANKEVPKLLRLTKGKTGFFKEKFENDENISHFKMFYPYRFADETAKIKGVKGGVQEVDYDYKNSKITVIGKVSRGKKGTIEIDESENAIFY
ncbi:MAG: PhzF family phenazine biosynthesis protein [Fusobacteriaceae bacterium]|jgi:predicted PhzF superfamily epimerase YddE/YHI9|nr:PhzF family phenazine biosynthesis protein [Fusobacteriaceae bacterium]